MPTLPIGASTDEALRERMKWVQELLGAPPRVDPLWTTAARELPNPKGNLDPQGNPFASFANAAPETTAQLARGFSELDLFPAAGFTLQAPKLAKGIITAGKAALEGDEFLKVYEDLQDAAKNIRRATMKVSPTFAEDVDQIAFAGLEDLADPSKYASIDELYASAQRKMLRAAEDLKERSKLAGGSYIENIDTADTAEDFARAEGVLTEGEEAAKAPGFRAENTSPTGLTANLEGEGGIALPKSFGPRSRAFRTYSKIVAQKKSVREAAHEVAGPLNLSGYTKAKDAYYKTAKPLMDQIRESLYMGEALRPQQAISAAEVTPGELAGLIGELSEGLGVRNPAKSPVIASGTLKFLTTNKTVKQLAREYNLSRDPAKLRWFSNNIEQFTDKIFETLRQRHPDKAQFLQRIKTPGGGSSYQAKGVMSPEKRETLSRQMRTYWNNKKTTLGEE